MYTADSYYCTGLSALTTQADPTQIGTLNAAEGGDLQTGCATPAPYAGAGATPPALGCGGVDCVSPLQLPAQRCNVLSD